LKDILHIVELSELPLVSTLVAHFKSHLSFIRTVKRWAVQTQRIRFREGLKEAEVCKPPQRGKSTSLVLTKIFVIM
jgi:hypothetical protein